VEYYLCLYVYSTSNVSDILALLNHLLIEINNINLCKQIVFLQSISKLINQILDVVYEVNYMLFIYINIV
jgi:hypothetical protein